MASELEANVAGQLSGTLIAAMDRIATSVLDIMADMPRAADGQIRDPYGRGVMDGVIMLTNGLRTGFEQAVQEISGH